MSKYQRCGAIELLRFLFAIAIALFHGCSSIYRPDLGLGKLSLFHNGAVGVEFFFVVSGFLMANSVIHTYENGSKATLGTETLNFFCRKYGAVFPYHLFFYITAFVVSAFSLSGGGISLIRLFIDSLPNLFLLDMTGLEHTMVNGFEWYLSAMLIAMVILYPLLRKFPDFFIKIGAGTAAILIYGYISHNWQTVTWVTFWTGFTFKGVLRAIAGILLGWTAYGVCRYIKQLDFTRLGKFFISAAEIGIYLVSFVFINLNEPDKYYIHFAFLFAIAVALTFSGKSITANIGCGKFIGFLGRLSLPMYIGQWTVLSIVTKFINLSPPLELIIYFIGTCVIAVLCMVVVDTLRKINIRKVFVKQK